MSETHFYIVQAGDSPESIARQLGVTVSQFQALPENGFMKDRQKKGGYPLYPGDRLAVPDGAMLKNPGKDPWYSAANRDQLVDYLLMLSKLHPATAVLGAAYQVGTSLTAPSSSSASSSKKSKGTEQDASLILPLQGYSKKHARIKASVVLTKPIEAAFLLLVDYLPKLTIMTSGYRSDADQERVINDYDKVYGGDPSQKDVEKRRQWLISKPRELKIARVGGSQHRTGFAFDLSGGNLSEIQAAVLRCKSEHGDKFPLLDTLIERKQNCLHVNLKPTASVTVTPKENGSSKPKINGTVTVPKIGNAFIDSVAADAIESQRVTSVPASVTLAQAILESGWGKSGLSKKYHNYFGIKGKGPAGTTVMSTWEHLGGKDVTIKAGFRIYNTPAESFADHGWFLVKNKRYSEAFKHTDDAERFAKEIHKAGYATAPKYADTLIQLIRQYKLTKFDEVARSQGTLESNGSQSSQGSSNSKSSYETAPSLAGVLSGKSTLRLNMRGPAVEEVQNHLVRTGYMTQEQKATGPGIFGNKTLAAVIAFQRDANIKDPSGVVDKTTLDLLRTTTVIVPKQETKPTTKPSTNNGSGSASSALYDGKKPAPGTDKDPWVPLEAPVRGDPQKRSAKTYTAVIKQFAVTANRRYKPTSSSTYCNIFAWDVTRAMGSEIPHWVDQSNNPAVIGKKNRELTANDTLLWLKDHGSRYGWKQLGKSDRPKDGSRPAVWKTAQDLANKGFPVVVVWRNPGGIGHIGVIRPGEATANGPSLAQAGRNNVEDGQVHDSTTFGNRVVEYWANANGKEDPKMGNS